MTIAVDLGRKATKQTNVFSTAYTKVPHNLINVKLTQLFEQTIKRECSFYLACNDTYTFFTSELLKRYISGHVTMFLMLLLCFFINL